MTPPVLDLTGTYAPAEVFSFLLVQVPTMVRVCGVHNFQFGSGAQGFFRLCPSKERRCGHLLVALGTERQKGAQKTCRHGTVYFTPASCPDSLRRSEAYPPDPTPKSYRRKAQQPGSDENLRTTRCAGMRSRMSATSTMTVKSRNDEQNRFRLCHPFTAPLRD